MNEFSLNLGLLSIDEIIGAVLWYSHHLEDEEGSTSLQHYMIDS